MEDEGLKTSTGIFKILKSHYTDDEMLNKYEMRAKFQDINNEIKNPETVMLEKEVLLNLKKAAALLTGQHKIAFNLFENRFTIKQIAFKMKITKKSIFLLLLEADDMVETMLNDIYK